MRQDFLQLEESKLAGKILVLDIDGTLVFDQQESFTSEIAEKIKRLSQIAEIYLCSNGSAVRTQKLAQDFGLKYLAKDYKKPDPRLLSNLLILNKQLVVIGDKISTDGLLAVRTGSDFILVASKRRSTDSLLTKLTYWFDVIVEKIFWPGRRFWPYLFLIRPNQWLKNFLIFAPLFFAGEFFNFYLLNKTIGAFIVFCLVTSAAYIFNDLRDEVVDRQHPQKKYRPIALRIVSTSQAKKFFVFIAILILVGLWFNPGILPVILIYLGLNWLYSSYLKHLAVIDLVIVAVFFVLRLELGGIVAGVEVSPWIILCVFFGALFLVAGKRRAELNHNFRRPVLEKYSPLIIDGIIFIAATLAISTYALYSVLVVNASGEIYTVPLVVAVILRLINLMWLCPTETEATESFIFKDKISLVIIGLWFLVVLMLIY